MYALPLLLSLGALGSIVRADPSTITTAPAQPTHLVERQAAGTTTYETTTPLPLTEYFFPYSQIPYQVNPYAVERGPQSGYNECNSTTEGPNSQCQTGVLNSIDDFCLWGGPGTSGGEVIADIEAAVVAYCTKSGHGARIIAPGAISALQFMRTPAYIQVTGIINITALNLDPADPGGELDPHGADLAGNPLGGLMYSTGFSSASSNTTYVQTQSWNNFVDGDLFCFKMCDPGYSTDANYCQNIYDILGCTYNAPAAYAPGVFLSCDGDIQTEVGTYTSAGQTITWSQPSSLAPDTTLPWTPDIPASSNCVTYQSSDLFPASLLGYQGTGTTTSATAASTGSSSGAVSGASATSSSASSTAKGSSSKSGSTTAASSTGSAAAASTTKASSGQPVAVGFGASSVGLTFAAAAMIGGLVVLAL